MCMQRKIATMQSKIEDLKEHWRSRSTRGCSYRNYFTDNKMEGSRIKEMYITYSGDAALSSVWTSSWDTCCSAMLTHLPYRPCSSRKAYSTSSSSSSYTATTSKHLPYRPCSSRKAYSNPKEQPSITLAPSKNYPIYFRFLLNPHRA